MHKKVPSRPAICTECHAQFEAVPRLNFFGLFRFKCPSCGKAFLSPMSTRRRKVYVGIAAAFGVLCLAILATGHIPIPGILPIGAAAGLIQDSGVRKRLAAAQSARL